jgi:thioredoxin-like negative regulator of GroEL
VTTLTFVAMLYASVAATGAETYAEAHRETAETGKPLVVMVGTDWCGPCQQMKKTVLPEVMQQEVFKKVSFATVNADREAELAKTLTGGGPVPQLVMYRQTRFGWKRRKLVGGQTVQSVQQFIQEGVAQNEAEKKGADDASNTPPEKDQAAADSDQAADKGPATKPVSSR